MKPLQNLLKIAIACNLWSKIIQFLKQMSQIVERKE